MMVTVAPWIMRTWGFLLAIVSMLLLPFAGAVISGLPVDACLGFDPTAESFEFECAASRWFLIMGDNVVSGGTFGISMDVYVCAITPGTFVVEWNGGATGVGDVFEFVVVATSDPTCAFGASGHVESSGEPLTAAIAPDAPTQGQSFRATLSDDGGTVHALLLWPGA